jgi:large subunit ribosomal protein L25
MSNQFEIVAETRAEAGKGASRRLRREQRVPGILYGAGKDPVQISVVLKDLMKSLENEAFYSHILTVKLDGKSEQAVLRDMQRHPVKGVPSHIDLQRVDASHKITMRVPLHFLNEAECPGVKQNGGKIHHDISEVEVQCLPKDLPEYVQVDMGALDIGQHVHLSDLKLPAGVQLVALVHGHDLSVASVQAPKGGGDEEAPAAAGGEAKE